jgi:uracil phosphoribosyltransferase
MIEKDALNAHCPKPGGNINVLDHPIALNAMGVLLHERTPPEYFRAFSRQLLMLLAIESTRTLPVREHTDEPLPISGSRGFGKRMIFLALSGHCLGLIHQVAEFIPDISVGLINLRRGESDTHHDSRLHLVNAPALSDACVILFNPVVSTGSSTNLALEFLHRSGAVDVRLLSFLVSAAGLERVLGKCPDLPIWAAAIDRNWDSKQGAFPGLGDFGARLYG